MIFFVFVLLYFCGVLFGFMFEKALIYYNVRRLLFFGMIYGLTAMSSLYLYYSSGHVGYLNKIKLSASEFHRMELINMAISSKLNESMKVDDCKFLNEKVQRTKLNECYEKFGSAFVLVGDSHGMNLHNILVQSDVFPFILSFVDGGCRLHAGLDCVPREYLGSISKDGLLDKVVYHQAGKYFFKEQVREHLHYDKFSPSLQDTEKVVTGLAELARDIDATIIILGPFYELNENPAVYVGRPSVALPIAIKRNFAKVDELLVELTANAMDLSHIAFNQVFDYSWDIISEDCFIYRDKNHLSTCGEKLISERIDTGFYREFKSSR